MFQKQRVNRRGKASKSVASNPGMDLLEPRQLLSNTLLGISPQAPIIGYDNQGQLTYTASTQALHVACTPLNIQQVANGPVDVIYSNIGDLKINIQVDNAGHLVGGVAGDDLVVTGDADLDGDYVPDVSGVLLTGEILQFGSLDTGTTVDKYEFLFLPTGGLLGSLYAGQEVGITMTSEHSNFVDSFQADFAGGAKGNLGAVQGILEQPSIRIDKSGPVIAHAGQAITYTYSVINPGTTPLSNVTVLDDNATPGNTADDFYATYTGGDVNTNGQLDPGETWTYSGTTTPTFSLSAPLVNTATATASWGNDVVTAQANYTLNPYLVNKSLYLYYGSTTCKTYAIPYTVADNTAFTIQAYKGTALVDTFTVSAGSPQGLWLSDGSYSFQEVNLPTGYVSVSGAVAYATGQGQTATGTFRNVVKYDLAVDKTGPETAAPGQTITYSYAVTDAGPASVVPTIKDDKTGTPTYVGGDTNGDGLLNPGETWLYQANYTVPSTTSTYGGCGSWGSWGWGGCGSFLPQCGTSGSTSITNTVTVDEKSNPHATGIVGGDTNLANNTDSWTVKVSTAAAATGSLSGYVYVDKDKDGTRDCGEAGIPFVKLTLTGTDSAGNAVTKSTWTDCDGAYRFSNLPAGKYTITETQPGNYNQGANRAGTLGGTVAGDSITNIVLPSGGKGVCYNFGERLRSTGGCGWDTTHDYNNKWCWDWNSDRSGCDWGRGWDVCGGGSYNWGGCF